MKDFGILSMDTRSLTKESSCKAAKSDLVIDVVETIVFRFNLLVGTLAVLYNIKISKKILIKIPLMNIIL